MRSNSSFGTLNRESPDGYSDRFLRIWGLGGLLNTKTLSFTPSVQSLVAQTMHDSWPPKLDRFSSDQLLHEFESAAVFSTDGWKTAEVQLDDGELGVCVHLSNGDYGEEARERIRAVLKHLPAMDNRTLQACIDEQKTTGLHGRNYQNALCLVTIPNGSDVTLWYVGTGVNTEWDERFAKDDDETLNYVER